MNDSASRLFVSLATIGVIAAIASGLVLNGSPANVRAHRFDQRRLQDLQRISTTVQTYLTTHNGLPDSLDTLSKGNQYIVLNLKDAETGTPYEYRVVDAKSYELCASFAASDDNGEIFFGVPNPFWKHPEGKHCFTFEPTLPRGAQGAVIISP